MDAQRLIDITKYLQNAAATAEQSEENARQWALQYAQQLQTDPQANPEQPQIYVPPEFMQSAQTAQPVQVATQPQVDQAPVPEAQQAATQPDAVTNHSLVVLCSLFVLSLNFKTVHFNVTGPQFLELHKWSGKRYDAVLDFHDELAEQLLYFGVEIPTRLSDIYSYVGISEIPKGLQTSQDYLRSLGQSLEELKNLVTVLITHVDPVSQDVLIRIGNALAKDIWMVVAMLSEH